MIEGEGAKEILISLNLLKKWDIVHAYFPNETVSDYFIEIINTRYQAYSSLYDFQTIG